MTLRKYKPFTSSRRTMTKSDFSQITKAFPEKSLITKKDQKAGRNNRGRITVRFRGSGHKKRYRIIDFKRSKAEIPAVVSAIEYDPNRSAFIALLYYKDGAKSYIIAPLNLKVGDTVLSSESADIKPGNNMTLSKIPLGTMIHNIEIKPFKGGQLALSAGSSGTLVAKEGRYVLVKLPSGEVRKVLTVCRASIGQVGNVENENTKIGKAGRTRWLGWRPHVRGMCQNPIDHPMGGGEGKGKGNHPQTPWGKPCKGHKTRHNKRDAHLIVTARKPRKKKK